MLPVEDRDDDLDLLLEEWEPDLDLDLDWDLCPLDLFDLLDLGPLDLVLLLPDPDLVADRPRDPPLPAPLLLDLPLAGESPRDLLLALPPDAGVAGAREADFPRDFPRDWERDFPLGAFPDLDCCLAGVAGWRLSDLGL